MMTVSTSLRWVILICLLLALIIGPFLVLEATISVQVSRFLELETAPILAALLMLAGLALDVVLPIPSSLVSTAAGALLGFAVGALVCWAGMSLGCLIGYWIGATGGTLAIRRLLGDKDLAKAAALAERMGAGALILARAVPVLAEASTIAAGAAGFPKRKFILITGLANIGVAVAYAAVGAYAFETSSFLLAFAGAIIIPGVGLTVARLSRGIATPDGGVSVAKSNAESSQGCSTEARRDVSFSVQFDYPVYFTTGAFDPKNLTFLEAVNRYEREKRHKIIVFIDDHIAECTPDLNERLKAYFKRNSDHMALVSEPVCLPGGESCKDAPGLVDEIHDTLRRAGIDRHSFAVCIGGGAFLDVVGFAAATAHRGVRLIRFPTTVLAQNDAGVGVKNGINKFGSKNFAGTFQPPFAVINDACFLGGLGARDRRAGIAEAVKVALIRDREFFEFLERNVGNLSAFDPEAMGRMIRRCADLHLTQIAEGGDPFESGSARPLDFGHWAGHKLESLSKSELRHGEAVAIGMALDTRYSVLSGLLPRGEECRVTSLLADLGFNLWHPALAQRDAKGVRCILSGLRDFQEHLGGELTITLLSEIGFGVEVHEIDPTLVELALDWLKARGSG